MKAVQRKEETNMTQLAELEAGTESILKQTGTERQLITLIHHDMVMYI